MTRSVAELEAAGVAFVEATVVRCAAPTSAVTGDRAVVFGDGTIDGFVGGSCADQTVRLQALRALAELAGPLGFAARTSATAREGDFAAVVASLGHGDAEAVRAGLEAGCEYVGLVASRVRGAAVLSELRGAGVDDALLARVRTPAGLDIHARTHAEIALAILAELVAVRRGPRAVPEGVPPAAGATPRTAVDPVCGMTVVVDADTPVAGGEAFCCIGCRDAWLARAG